MVPMKTIKFYLQHPFDSIERAELASRVRQRVKTIRVQISHPKQKPPPMRHER